MLVVEINSTGAEILLRRLATLKECLGILGEGDAAPSDFFPRRLVVKARARDILESVQRGELVNLRVASCLWGAK